MRTPPFIHSRSIAAHLLSWFCGLVALVLYEATGVEYFLIVCLLAAMAGFLSSVVALPVAIHGLFRYEQWAFWTRVFYSLVAILAAIVLVGGVVSLVSFKIMTAGRH
jgi:hypothetical protein